MKTLDLYITKVCNLNCEYCYVDLKNHENPFDLGGFSERINLLSYDHIKFFGGEPLLKFKEIQKIVEALKGKGKQFTIVTNGLLLNKKILQFCLKNHIEIVISMHLKSIKQMLPKVQKFVFADRIIGFSFIFEDNNLSYPYKIVNFLQKIGFSHFVLTPEVYGNWNDENLKKLETELSKFILLYKQNQKLKFTGPSKNFLPKIIKGCTKNIVTHTGERKPCNRFKSLKNIEKNTFKELYSELDKYIDYENDGDKWFYVCPIGWYLDTLTLSKDFSNRVIEYKNLNKIFVKFYRTLNNISGKINFLTEQIDEIRFNLTSQCNLRCEYCYVDFKNDKLDFSIAKNIIDFLVLRPGHTKTISFFGGEPFLQFNLLQQIVEYAQKVFRKKNKKLFFKIATNFLLINKERMDFLRDNNFEIHISWNGLPQINNKMRDNSTGLLLKNLELFCCDYKNLVILLAFSPEEVGLLYKNVKYITTLGIEFINLEMIFGEKYIWKKSHFVMLQNELIKIKKSNFFHKGMFTVFDSKKNILDISPKGECSENSFGFNQYNVNLKNRGIFKELIAKNFIV